MTRGDNQREAYEGARQDYQAMRDILDRMDILLYTSFLENGPEKLPALCETLFARQKDHIPPDVYERIQWFAANIRDGQGDTPEKTAKLRTIYNELHHLLVTARVQVTQLGELAITSAYERVDKIVGKAQPDENALF